MRTYVGNLEQQEVYRLKAGVYVKPSKFRYFYLTVIGTIESFINNCFEQELYVKDRTNKRGG